MLQNRFANSYILVAVFLSLCSSAWAENFFKLEPIEYFQVIKKKDKNIQLFDWRTPMMSADGKLTYYEPPRTVLNLLNDPSIDNAKRYVAWQQEKMDRINKAQLAIASIAKDGE